MIDIGLTHIALPVSDVDRTIEFYSKYAGMQVIHSRIDAEAGVAVVWLSDRTRPWINPFRKRDIKVELRKSDQCQANWVKADVPKDTVLYLKDQAGKTYVRYTTQVNGVSYGDMMNYRTPFSACAKLPDGREVCTSIVGN
ncbi:VOC family protein [Microcoleus sp. A003_D6]|uniref:VOC family protein n=1 Tax=Microcoleus sp. A003_D6 TaxID=3055266 RepID=UPI002FD1ADC9